MEAGKQYEINYGYLMTLDGWVNCWDRMPEVPGEYLVEGIRPEDKMPPSGLHKLCWLIWKGAKNEKEKLYKRKR